jgi:methionine sulfoxide reductase heme-binding subunit
VARGGHRLNAALWYLSRGSGAVALILLSTTVVLGIVDQRRWHSRRWPRFALHSVHRWVGLFAVSFLSIHIFSVVADGFVQIRLLDALVPFGGSYRPLWLGFGALAFDLLLAVAITSLLRRHIGQRNWRTVHWLAYAAWPVALVHGLGIGSDSTSVWMLALVAVCVGAVWIAVSVRLSSASSGLRESSDGRRPTPRPSTGAGPPAVHSDAVLPVRAAPVHPPHAAPLWADRAARHGVRPELRDGVRPGARKGGVPRATRPAEGR